MARRSAAAALETRESIVNRAVEVASVEGLEGVTIGRLAADLEMSKAGVIGHFGTKEALQLAALRDAGEQFIEAVWRPAEHRAPGLDRLLGICEAWSRYLAGGTFPGGCFMTAASFEFDDRPGAVREQLVKMLRSWRRKVEAEARVAVEQGELPAGTDPEQIAFEIGAIAAGTVQARRLHRDTASAERCLNAMRRVLGVD